jgi:hypothetical protein
MRAKREGDFKVDEEDGNRYPADTVAKVLRARPGWIRICASDRAFRRGGLEVAPGLPDRNAGVVGVAGGFQLVQCCCEDGEDAFKHDEPRYFSVYAGSIAPWLAWVNSRARAPELPELVR